MARRAGYTLIELMMVVMIIAMSTLAFAPGIGRAVADRRASTAARELIRIGRRARADTIGLLRAHLLWISPTTGRVQLLRGNTNSCTLATAGWQDVAATCATTPRGARCLEDLSIGAITNNSIALYQETLSGSTPSYVTTPRALCYAASGVVFAGTGASLQAAAGALSQANDVNGGFVYTLHQGTSEPTTTSRIHRVLFPLGGTARSLR